MNVIAPSRPVAVPGSASRIRVMVVDDALVARGFVLRWVENEPDMEIVASLRDGREAVDQIVRIDPDVVVLDIEMPNLDGIAALPILLEKKPDLAIIMASTLTRRNAEITLKALSLGALDCIPKPDANSPSAAANFRRELIDKIRELGRLAKRGVLRARVHGTPATARRARPALPGIAARAETAAPFTLRPFPRSIPRVLLIGSSTGGPQALSKLAGHLQGVSDRAPILITQHMPPTFTTILAETLARVSGRPVAEAQDGEPILAGRIYIAPGDRHMCVKRRDGHAVIQLDDGPPVHFCKPAVDPLFSSAAQIWGGWTLGLILTGMGTDGTNGAADIVAGGGCVVAQDEDTSVVWGMPGSAAHAGLCSAVLPLDEIAPKIASLFAGERS